MGADRQTDRMKLIVVFLNFSNAPKNTSSWNRLDMILVVYLIKLLFFNTSWPKLN